MKKIKIIILALLLTGLLIMLSCDRRGRNVTGPVASYTIEVFASDSISAPKDTSRIGCFIKDQSGELVDGILVSFDAFIDPEVPDSAELSPSRTSSDSDTEDGLSGAALVFYPTGEVGDFHIVASINGDGEDAQTDTTIIQVLPYTITLNAYNTTLSPNDTTSITCVVQHPATLQDVVGIHLQFSTDFGSISPDEASSDTTINGMDTSVKFTAPEDATGIANISVIATLYPEHVMGSDTMQITVTE